jgi:hypothetical protein
VVTFTKHLTIILTITLREGVSSRENNHDIFG